MLQLKRTNSDALDFQSLVVELDKDLAIRDGEEHLQFYTISMQYMRHLK